ncbi:MAG: CBS domain-containing protein [Verrucomicrobia bacterium]|nr:CBS domain-containing protein [Verrucomicrobiota bacterium]
MMSVFLDMIIPLVSLFAFLFMHALLVMGETGLISVRYGKLARADLEALRKHRGIARVLSEGDRAGGALRFGKVLCLLALGMQVCILALGFSVQGEGLSWVSLFLAGLPIVFLFYVVGYYLPQALALRCPVVTLRLSAPLLVSLKLLLLPLRFLSIKEFIFKRIGVDGVAPDPMDMAVQLRALGLNNTRLSPVVCSIVSRSIQMQDLVVHDVLLPRNEVVIYDLNEDLATNLGRMKGAGHTRYPLCRGDLDDCLGIIHIKDIFRSKTGELAMEPDVLMRPTGSFLLETPLEEALQRMLRTKFHMGLVYDSFGGALGVVTLERILEELVGDIQDEFDSEEERIEALREPGCYQISGLAPMHDVEMRLGLETGNDEVSTFGGFVTGELGRIPKAGEQLTVHGLQIEIVRVDERRILTTRVRLLSGVGD